MKHLFLGIVAFAFYSQAALANTDLLGLANLAEGSAPPYGENIVVEQDEKTSVKWITRGKSTDTNGKLKFPVSLSGEFELLFEADTHYSGMELFLTADEYKVKLTFYSETLYAGSESAGGDQSGARTNRKNTYKLSVSNNIAKLYINDVFSQKITLKPDLTYTQLLIQDLDNGQIYTLTISGSGGSTQPPVTGGDFDSGKQAGIQQCVSNPASCGISVSGGTCTGGVHATYNTESGEVHIPLIDVPGPFGEIQTYEVYLLQQPSTFTFNLDLGRLLRQIE